MTFITGNPTILIVDDTPSNLSVVVNLFEERGYRVAIAQDGEEGIQRAQLLQPDLILLDVMMPGIDGFEACGRLKEQESTRDIPVIFMTALASAEHKVKGFQSGAVDYVTKPLQIDEVMARVDTHLKLHAAQRKLAEHNEELERRVAERTAELAAREREFRTLAENLPDNLARYDKQGRIVYLNPQLESFQGKKTKEVQGQTVMESDSASIYAEYYARLAETIATGQSSEVELIFPDMGEGVRYHHIRVIAERDADGEILGALAIGRDITERKKTERELLLLNRAVNASSEAVFLMDAQGRFVYVNEEACRSLGYSRAELLTMTPLDIDTDCTAEMLQGMMAMDAATGQSSPPFETRHRARDGRIFPVEIVPTPIVLEGEHYFLSMTRDISARKEAERILHEQQQAIRAVVENSPDAYARYDRQFRRIYVNPATQGLLGLPLEEILGKTPVPGAVVPVEFTQLLESVFLSGEELRTELPFRWPNGEKGWGDVRIVPEFGPDGGVASVLTIGRDITERKLAEQALIVREREFRTLAENIPDHIIRYDAQGRRIFMNMATARLMGVETEELLNLTLEETPEEILPMKIDEYARLLRKVLESGEPQEFEATMWHVKEGKQIQNIKFVAERDEQGAIVGALVVGHDITALKAIESELKEREQRYREIFDNAVEGMYLLEVTEDRRFRNIDINPALAASTGVPREAMIGKFVDEAVSEEAGRQVVQKYLRCLDEGKTIAEEIELDLPAGKRNYYSTITPIYYRGRIHRLIGISRDITELKKAERELKESRAQLRGLTAQREAAREEERKYIAREVHDELGQILTGLKLSVSVLDHKLAAGRELTKAQLQETMQLTDRALEVARNVASALRPSALEMGIVSALEWLAGRFGTNTGIHCEVHIADDEIEIDEVRAIALFRIVQESLTNVARHAKAERVDVTLSREADDYVLKVRDNGIGFDMGRKKTESFGLVGISERALMLGGTVAIESRPGKGTEIAVHIPVQTVAEES